MLVNIEDWPSRGRYVQDYYTCLQTLALRLIFMMANY